MARGASSDWDRNGGFLNRPRARARPRARRKPLKHPLRIFRPVRSNRRDPLHTLARLNESSTRTIDRGPW
jgi:hypothetical protein